MAEDNVLTYQEYKQAGFSDAQIQKFLKPKLEDAGYSNTEINQFFYQQSGNAELSFMGIENNKNIKDMAKAVSDIQYKASLEGKNLNMIDAIKLGWQQSVTGMVTRGELPTELTEEQAKTLNFFERTVMGIANVVSDIPVYALGAKAGAVSAAGAGAAVGSLAPGLGTVIGGATGAAVGGSIGAFGFHAAARQMLIDMYSRGEVASWDELLHRVGNASKEFAKGALIGTATMGASKLGAIGKSALMGSTMARAQTAAGNIVNITAKTMPVGSEILGLTTASSLIDGHVPTAQDFVDNAVLIASLKGMNLASDYGRNKVKNKAIDYMYRKFVQEGKGPAEITRSAQADPKVLEDIVKDSGEYTSAKLLNTKKTVDITKSPEFSNWFGNGALKDNKGNPIKVYHITPSDVEGKVPFREFKPNVNAIFVTPDKEFTEVFKDDNPNLGGGPTYTFELYTNIKNIFDPTNKKHMDLLNTKGKDFFNSSTGWSFEKTMQEVKKGLKDNPDDTWEAMEIPGVRDMVQKLGFDAVKLTDWGYDTYMLFDPKQLKSVDNVGTFSPDTGDVFAKTYPGYTPIPRPKGRTVLPKEGEVSIDASVKRSDIFNKLADAVAIPVRLGKVGVRKAVGIYKPKAEVIRIRQAKDLTTLGHELAHHFEKVVFGRVGSKEISSHYDELSKIATKPAGKPNKNTIAAEGFAEFVSKYLVNPKQAKEVAPKFYEVFEKDIGPKLPEVFKAIKDARKDIIEYYKQPYVNEVLSNISNRPTEELTPKEKWEQIKYNFITKWLDDKNPIKYAVEQVEKRSGVKLSLQDNAYFLSRMFPGWTGKAEAFLQNKPFSYSTLRDIDGAKSLKEIVQSVKNWDEFTAYLTAARALELNARGIETGIDMFAAKATERQLKKKYKALADDLYKYQDALLQYQKDSGLISMEDYAAIKEANKKYVPFQRVIEKGTGAALGSKRLSSKQTIRGIKGSTRDIINPLESIIKNTFETINAVERNRVGQAIAKLSALDKSGLFVEKLPAPKEIVPLSKGINNDSAEAYLLRGIKYDRQNEILVYENGKPSLYKVDPDIAKVINGVQGSVQKIEALNFLKFFTKVFRAGTTGLNLAFAAKNLIRDNFFAYMSSKADYKPFIESLGNAKIAITKDKAYWEFLKAGASQSSFVSVDRNALQKNIDDLSNTGYLTKVWNRAKDVYDSAGKLDYKKTLENINLLLDRVLDLPAVISETSELSTRIGEFRNSMKNKPWTKENIEKAGYNAREVTLDFAKGGIYGKTINQFKAFFNANLLGLEKVYNIATDRHAAIKAIWMLGTLGTLTALANYDWENGQEDQDIREVLQAQKDTNWVLKVWGTDTIVRIPKPQQVGFISTMFEQLTTDMLNGLNKQERDEVVDNLFAAFVRESGIPTSWSDAAQALSPTMLTPIMENWGNKSMFFGTPIVPATAEGALPEYQYTENTRELTKAISSTLGMFVGKTNTISPAQIENLVRGWTGGVGNYLMDMIDLVGRKSGVLPDPPKATKDLLTDIPFVRAFTIRHPVAGANSINRWYDEYAKREEYLKSFEIAGKKFDEASMDELAKYQIYSGLKPIQQAISQTSRQIRIINALPDMDPDEKRQNIDALYITRINIARQGLKMIREMDSIISSKGPKKGNSNL